MNLPNLLTLSRIPILFVIVGLLYLPLPGARVLAAIFFALGAFTDYLDGYYARKMGIVSNFGKLMDALTDKVFMVGLFIAFLAAGLLPAWALPLLLLILAREFLITGLRLVAASEGIVLAAEKSGKHKTVSQIVAASLLLAAEMVRVDLAQLFPDWVFPGLLYAGWGFFVLATFLTISSGAGYLIRYWSIFTGQVPGKKEDERGQG